MSSLVTVLTPLYNNAEDIQTAIQSVLNQTYVNWELIVIDDCSTDDGLEKVQDLIQKHPQKNIKILKNSQNYGPYVSLNIGLQAATGEYICRLDSDDRLTSNAIEVCLNSLQAHIDVVHFLAKRNDGHVFDNVGLFYRKTLIEKIGYYDSVRFAADVEFKHRIYSAVPKEKICKINTILYLIKKRRTSLSLRNDTGTSKIALGVRQNYIRTSSKWHKDSSNLYISFPLPKRPFPIHEMMETGYH